METHQLQVWIKQQLPEGSPRLLLLRLLQAGPLGLEFVSKMTKDRELPGANVY